MSAPGPCLVQGAIGPGARDRGLALDKNCIFVNYLYYEVKAALKDVHIIRVHYISSIPVSCQIYLKTYFSLAQLEECLIN